MAAAVLRTAGEKRSMRSVVNPIERWTAKFSAATTSPERLLIGAAIERRPYASSSSFTAMPGVFSIGWSNDLLSHNPNLAEGQLVKDALFVVNGGEARLVPDPLVTIPKKPDWKDDTVTIEGNVATVKATAGNSRFAYTLTVSPHRAYHVSVWVKTQDFTAEQTYLQPPEHQTDVVHVIKGVIEAETGAIEHYNGIIEFTDGLDYVTQDMVIDILHDEEGHRRLFEGYLREYEAEGLA